MSSLRAGVKRWRDESASGSRGQWGALRFRAYGAFTMRGKLRGEMAVVAGGDSGIGLATER
jgi:hypothetical protein